VLFVICTNDYYSPDYVAIRPPSPQIRVHVAAPSKTPGTPQSAANARVITPDLALADAHAEDYEAIVFCGGKGITEYVGDGAPAREARRLIAEALKAKPPLYLMAVGSGPIILAHSGCLRGVRATGFPPSEFFNTKRELEDHGAIWVGDQPVVESGRIITGMGSRDYPAFGKVLYTLLKK
jgi:putative intracellular protease/amidase